MLIHTLADGRTINLTKIQQLCKKRCKKSKYPQDAEDFSSWAVMRVLEFSSKLNKNAHLCNINWLFDEYLYVTYRDGSKVKDKKVFVNIDDVNIAFYQPQNDNIEVVKNKNPLKYVTKKKTPRKRQIINEEMIALKIKECTTASSLKTKYKSFYGFLLRNKLLDKYYPKRETQKPIKVRDTKTGIVYESISACAKALNILPTNITHHLKGRTKTIAKTKLETV
jgi:hypothetical protein